MTDLMQYADVIKQKDQHDEGFQRSLIVVKGYLVDVENTGTPLVSARSGFVWVREYGANGGVFQAFLSPKVQARVELPVLIMYNPVKPFLRQVIDVDWSEMINYEDFDNQPLLGLHAADHEWPDFTPGADPVNIHLRALVPLKTFPNVGLTVRMAPFVYEVDNEVREYFGETSVDLSTHQPASGEAVYVLTYFDVEANAAASIAGTPVADSPAVTPNIPDVPENAYQSALVRLDGDQTSFAETDIKDIRKLYEISKTASIRGATLLDVATAVGEVDYILSEHIVNHPATPPAGTDGQLQYNNGGAFGGFGVWDDSVDQLLINGTTAAFAGTVAEFHDSLPSTSIGIVNESASADANIAATTYYLKNSAESYRAFGYFSVGSVTRTNGAEDGYFDISVMKGGTVTSMLDIRPSVITLNPGEGNTDVRIAGNGVTNGIYYDAGNNRVGIGTAVPDVAFHIVGAVKIDFSGATPALVVGDGLSNAFLSFNGAFGSVRDMRFQTAGSDRWILRTNSVAESGSNAGSNFQIFSRNDAGGPLSTVLEITRSNGAVQIARSIQVGFPTGGDPGAGWVNVAGGVKLNNTNYTNPDYALHHYFYGDLGPFADNPGADKYGGLVPLDKLEKYLKKNIHLPNRWESQNIFEWADMAQMWCEELAIYITQLHKRVKDLENGR